MDEVDAQCLRALSTSHIHGTTVYPHIGRLFIPKPSGWALARTVQLVGNIIRPFGWTVAVLDGKIIGRKEIMKPCKVIPFPPPEQRSPVQPQDGEYGVMVLFPVRPLMTSDERKD